MSKRTKLGLIGRNISYSFSQGYFSKKFEKEGITELNYRNYDLPEVDEFPFITYHREEEFLGFNVTIPYKQSIKKYLQRISPEAEEIGAVNTIKVTEDHQLVGYNTDAYGFENSLKPLLEDQHKKALILGTGGASKAVAFVLKKLGIVYIYVSRTASEGMLAYEDLTEELIQDHNLIINCTPLGTHPNVTDCPDIPYGAITDKHLLYDLIYNPAVTQFLQNGLDQGAKIKNGLQMLELQAEKSWEIWNYKPE